MPSFLAHATWVISKLSLHDDKNEASVIGPSLFSRSRFPYLDLVFMFVYLNDIGYPDLAILFFDVNDLVSTI
jgi:hypothetical protein